MSLCWASCFNYFYAECCNAKCRYAGCRYAVCCYAECRVSIIFMLNVVMQSVVMLSVVTMSAVMLSVVTPYLRSSFAMMIWRHDFYRNDTCSLQSEMYWVITIVLLHLNYNYKNYYIVIQQFLLCNSYPGLSNTTEHGSNSFKRIERSLVLQSSKC